jgi:zinc protease
MIRAPLLAVLLLVAGSCATASLYREPTARPLQSSFVTLTCPSGLQVVVNEDRSSSLLVVAATYRVGGRGDPQGKAGLAHLVEHLTYRARLDEQSLSDRLTRAGAVFNAVTAADFTTYYAVAHKDRLDELLAVERARLSAPLLGLSEEVLAAERGVVRNEVFQNHNASVQRRIVDELLVSLYPSDHPMGRRFADDEASLASLGRGDVERFVTEHHRPDQVVLVVAGNVSAADVKSRLARWPEVNQIPPGQGPSPSMSREVPPPADTKLRRLSGGSARQLTVAWSVPPEPIELIEVVQDRVQYAMLSLGRSQGVAGVVVSRLRLRDGAFLSVQARLTPEADPEQVREAIQRRMDSATVQGRNRSTASSLTAETMLSNGDVLTRALKVASAFARTGKPGVMKARVDALLTATQTEVTALVERYLTPPRAVAVLTQPEEEARTRDDSSGDVEPGASDATAAGNHLNIPPEKVDLAGMNSDAISAVAHSPGLAAFPRVRLGNGVELVTVTQPGWDWVEVQVQVPGGRATVLPPTLATRAVATSSPCEVTEGANRVSHTEWRTLSDFSTRFGIRAGAGNADFALALASDQVRCRRLSGWYSEPRPAAPTPSQRASDNFWSALYPGYAPMQPSALEVTRDGAERYLHEHFRPDGALVVVVSDTPAAEVRPFAESFFGRWTSAEPRQDNVAAPGPTPHDRVVRLFDRPGAAQSEVVLGCRLANVTAETVPAFELLGDMVSEEASVLRRNWGASYGFAAVVDHHPDGAADLVIRGRIETPRTAEAIEKLLAVVNSLSTRGGSVPTFFRKRWDLARAYDLRFASGRGLASAILNASANRWPADVWDLYPRRLANLSFTSIRTAMGDCAGHEVLTVVGDLKAVRPALAHQGLKE